MNRYRFQLMGPPNLSVETEAGARAQVRLSRASLSLLSLIALGGAALSRALVAETLWPDAPPEKSSSRLSSALHRLQTAAGDGCAGILKADGGRIGLRDGVDFTIDVLQISACTAALAQRDLTEWEKPQVANLEAAINQRDGEFLDGLEGDWVLSARQRCAAIYEAGLEALIRFHRHRGHVERSIAAAKKLVRQDPYREDIQAVLVELYGAKGQRSRALAQYAACRDILHYDLGVRPGAALTTSLQGALAASPDDNNPDLIATLRRIDRTMDRLARQVIEIHAMLNRLASKKEQRGKAS